MNRRDFIRKSSAVTSGALAASVYPHSVKAESTQSGKFKLRYAPHFGQFAAHAGNDPVDQLKFMADNGFVAFEDNGMRGKPKEEQERIAKAAAQLGMEMGIFVANDDGLSKPILTSGDAAMRDRFLQKIRDSVEVAKRCNTKYATLVVGNESHRLQTGYQFANAVETLKRAAALCEPSGFILVGEPLNIYRDHPEFFIHTNADMYALMKAVNSPSVKVLFDIYHTQVNEGNIIPNIDRCWDEIAYFQTGDHPGRREPGTGEINYRNVFKHIHSKGYKGILGMEHGKSKPGKEGELALIAAYREADSF